MSTKWSISLDTHPEKYIVREFEDAIKIIGGTSAFDLDAFDATTAIIYKGDIVVAVLEKIGDEWFFRKHDRKLSGC
jgi:hypothetical protein